MGTPPVIPPNPLTAAINSQPKQISAPADVQASLPKTPSMAVGEGLAFRVLWIAVGSIVVLFVYLITMDLVVGSNLTGIYRQGGTPTREDIATYTAGQLEQFSHDVAQAQQDPKWLLEGNAKTRDQDVVASLSLLVGFATAQKDQLSDCITVMSTAGSDRSTKLAACKTVLDDIRTHGLGAAMTVTTLQIATESAARLGEQRQTFHQFWLQAAQLVLLNLLLPVLTAILGYTFGNQQAQQTQKGQ